MWVELRCRCRTLPWQREDEKENGRKTREQGRGEEGIEQENKGERDMNREGYIYTERYEWGKRELRHSNLFFCSTECTRLNEYSLISHCTIIPEAFNRGFLLFKFLTVLNNSGTAKSQSLCISVV